MATDRDDRITSYDFVATILWIGFLLSISFMEAPLRFRAESITVPLGLEIGRLVFHALNICEIVFATWVFFCQLRRSVSSRSRWLFYIALAILIFQTVLLFTVLDARTHAIIAGEDVPKSYHHTLYIVLEAIKLFTLALLAHSQIGDFKANLKVAC